jgi:hypothetical protein
MVMRDEKPDRPKAPTGPPVASGKGEERDNQKRPREREEQREPPRDVPEPKPPPERRWIEEARQ